MNIPRVLTIAGSDSGGGAGVQADLKTFSALGCYGMSAITALTAQNTLGVRAIHEPPPEFVAEQIRAVMDDIGADAIKIGMLSSSSIIDAVADGLEHYSVDKIVLDPVMVATSGDKLLREDAIDRLTTRLFPIAGVITPNLREATVLLGRSVGEDESEMIEAGCDLLKFGPRAILLKGGHGTGPESNDVLVTRGVDTPIVQIFRGPRIQTLNTHGTGCTLSSAIAAYWARGLSLSDAVAAAKKYLAGALASAANWRLGQGHGPVHHFYQL